MLCLQDGYAEIFFARWRLLIYSILDVLAMRIYSMLCALAMLIYSTLGI